MSTRSHVEAELKRRLEDAASYEERAMLRKVLRDMKKGAIDPDEALRITSSGDRNDTKILQASEEHNSGEHEQHLNYQEDSVTVEGDKLTVEEDNGKQRNATLIIGQLAKNTGEINHVTSRSNESKIESLTRAEKAKKSELSKDLLDSGDIALNRRWTVSGEHPKSRRLSRPQEQVPDVPFGQSMLRKTQIASGPRTAPTESSTPVLFGPSKLRRVDSRGSEDVKSQSRKKSTENPYGKVILRQTSRDDLKKSRSDSGQDTQQTGSSFGMSLLRKTSRDDLNQLHNRKLEESTKATDGSLFGKVILRQTSREELKLSSANKRHEEPTSQFSALLKKTKQGLSQQANSSPTTAKKVTSATSKEHASATRPRAATVSTSKPIHFKKDVHDEKPGMSAGDLRTGLAMYVNKELSGHQSLRHLLPVPLTGSGLYQCCSDALLLCKLINLSVRGTVDERALSTVEGSRDQRQQAKVDNLTLALESARAIGCQIDDMTLTAVLKEDKNIITQLLVDLLKARAVHSSEADQFGSQLFSNPHVLLSLFGVRANDQKPQSQRSDKDEVDIVIMATADEPDPLTELQENDKTDPDSTEKLPCCEVETDDIVSSGIPVGGDADKPASGIPIGDDADKPANGVSVSGSGRKDNELPKASESENGSYASRAAARKAAREKRRAQKQ